MAALSEDASDVFADVDDVADADFAAAAALERHVVAHDGQVAVALLQRRAELRTHVPQLPESCEKWPLLPLKAEVEQISGVYSGDSTDDHHQFTSKQMSL